MSDTTNREITITRVVDAPRELVWKAFTDKDHIGQWWGPNGFTTTTDIMDVRVGGTWRHTMVGPDGTIYPNEIHYEEVVPPEKLVYAHVGDTVMGFAPFQTTITLEVNGDKTKVTLRTLFVSPEEREKQIRLVGAEEGGKQTLARLAQYLLKNNY